MVKPFTATQRSMVNDWVSTDEAVASTAAISQYVDDERLSFLRVTKEETEEGRWARDGES